MKKSSGVVQMRVTILPNIPYVVSVDRIMPQK